MVDRAVTPRACPVCGSLARRVLFRQTFAVVEDATPVSGYDVAICDSCGCGFADGIPEQRVFDLYYRDMSKYEHAQRGGAESDYDRRRFEQIASLIAPQISSPEARILDIGCATGGLLAQIRDRGFANVTGLDPSPACAMSARRLYDIPVRTMTIDELATTGERFDVALMIGVLEHLRDLDTTFDRLRAVLDSEGLLYIEVPDVTAFADWPNAPYQDFSVEHINFFSPTSLDNLLRGNGFTQRSIEQNHREQSYNTVMSNISAMYRLAPSVAAFTPRYDDDTTSGLERYIAQCGTADKRLRVEIDALAENRQPILVWGVGTHTMRLMATSRLAEANIIAFVESNSRYHGKTLHGRPILGPDQLSDFREPIVVSSRVFQREIADQIRNTLGYSNRLVLLYDV